MHIWDYREKDLKKTEWGRRYILQNMITMGPGKRKISKKLVKKYWHDLDIDPLSHMGKTLTCFFMFTDYFLCSLSLSNSLTFSFLALPPLPHCRRFVS